LRIPSCSSNILLTLLHFQSEQTSLGTAESGRSVTLLSIKGIAAIIQCVHLSSAHLLLVGMLRETVYIVGIGKVSPKSDRRSLPPFAYEDVDNSPCIAHFISVSVSVSVSVNLSSKNCSGRCGVVGRSSLQADGTVGRTIGLSRHSSRRSNKTSESYGLEAPEHAYPHHSLIL